MKLTMVIGCVLALLLIGMSSPGIGARDPEPLTQHMITGTLKELDMSGMKGRVDTDLGHPIFFIITKPQLFTDLSVGSVVTIEIDSAGGAGKVMAASMAEIVAPVESYQPSGREWAK